jgi:beta-lactam-binding protein with PASTA domain
MHNTMIREGVVTEDNATLLIGRNQKAELLQAIRDAGRDMGPDDTLFIYNSSHGNKAGEFTARDANISGAELSVAIAGSGAGNVVFINDSCFSERCRLNLPGKNVAQIYAAGDKQVAWSSTTPLEEMGHVNGAMTKYIIEGLTDGAADINGDGRVTTAELNAWVRVGVRGSERDVPNLHGYTNNVSGQKPGATGNAVTVSTAEGNEEFQGQRLVPDVMRLTRDEAMARLEDDDLDGNATAYVIADGSYLGGYWAGRVVEQIPVRGVRVKPGATVTIKVATKETALVPEVIEKKVAEARAAIEAVGLKCRVGASGAGHDYIGFASPNVRVRVVQGSTVTISRIAPGQVWVPYIYGETRGTSNRLLRTSGLTGAYVIAKPSGNYVEGGVAKVRNYETYPPFKWAGKVWLSNPAQGAPTAKATNVAARLAPSPAVDVPYLAGMSEAEAMEALRQAGLVGSVHVPSIRQTTDNPPGVRERGWRPRPQAYQGDTIELAITYPEVPNLAGKTEAEAEALATKARLKLKTEEKLIVTARDFTKVAEQDPAAGGRLKRGAEITARFPIPVAIAKVKAIEKKTGKTIADVQLTLAGARAESVTAGSGQHTFAGLVKGKYTMTAQKSGYLAASSELDIDPKVLSAHDVTLALAYDPDTPREILSVSVTKLDGTPTNEIDRGSRFVAVCDPSPIPPGAQIGKVEWIMTSPSGAAIPSKKQRSGRSALTITVTTTSQWPYGEYGVAAIVHTKEHGLMSGKGAFTLKESEFLDISLKKPVFTGQWTTVEKIEELPFKIEKPAKVTIKGFGQFSDKKYWKLKGRVIAFRPIAEGIQQPTCVMDYEGQQVKLRGTVRVELTEMPIEIDWNKTKKAGKKTRVDYTMSLPISFEPSFNIRINPNAGVSLNKSPTKTKGVYRFDGHVIVEDLPSDQQIRFDLTDKTKAVAQGILVSPETCVCMRPPANVRRYIKQFENPQALIDKAMALQGDEDAAEAFGRKVAQDTIAFYDWIGGLDECKHLSRRARSAFTNMARLMRKAMREEEVSEEEGKALARQWRSLSKDDFKPGFMKGVMNIP